MWMACAQHLEDSREDAGPSPLRSRRSRSSGLETRAQSGYPHIHIPYYCYYFLNIKLQKE